FPLMPCRRPMGRSFRLCRIGSKQSSQKHAFGLDPEVAFPVLLRGCWLTPRLRSSHKVLARLKVWYHAARARWDGKPVSTFPDRALGNGNSQNRKAKRHSPHDGRRREIRALGSDRGLGAENVSRSHARRPRRLPAHLEVAGG